MPVLRWLMSLTFYQCFVCLIDIYQGIREHSIFRDYSNFDVDQYIRDVDAVDWFNVSNEYNNIHEETANCISILKQIADKHAPIKKASQRKKETIG